MSETTTVKVPDIGDFKDVEIIEVLVAPGDTVNAEDPLITLESDKATMDVPSPTTGTVKSVNVKVGERVSEGTAVVELETSADSGGDAEPEQPDEAPAPKEDKKPTSESQPEKSHADDSDMECELLVLGSGPGGYTAAFRAADLGLKTILVERYDTLGGVCLNVGCIPSKALLHAAKVIDEASSMAEHGIEFGKPKITPKKLLGWKQDVVGKLTKGLGSMARQRKVEVVTGTGRFVDAHHLTVATGDGDKVIRFDKAIIAAGSEAVRIPGLPDDDRIMDSTGALELADIPKRLLVIGGGIIGLEMATVYHALGSKVTVVEMLDGLMAGADPDIVRPFANHIKKQYENIFLKTKVSGIEAGKKLTVSFEGSGAPKSDSFDRVLVAVGRRPNGNQIDADKAGVAVDERGFIAVDEQMRTNVTHIFAIGDIVGQPMLAHKASHEAKVAAEVAAGMKSGFDARVIPSVAYTDPEVAWVGVTEQEAKQKKLKYGKGVFPWAASGRSLSLGRSEGVTKLLFDEETGRLIGAGIVGPNAGDLIAEAGLAIETGCDAADISLTVHPHPTLSETIAFAAEVFEGTITDLYLPKKK
jgi:dihydrolipoamide dehydrogenase